MKTENMTFSEALEAMKQGYKVRRKCWIDESYKAMISHPSCTEIVNCDGSKVTSEPISNILATDWGIYNEQKPEPQFEIGELVMMRNSADDEWIPFHFARKNESGKYRFQPMTGSWYVECAKFDKDIVFTNKPAKL